MLEYPGWRPQTCAKNKHALQTMLDRLSPTIAMVQPDGTIVRVNRSWRRFAIANGYRNADLGVGTSYLETCERGEREDPTCRPGTCAGIRSVLDGQAQSFSAEYPCDSPTEQRWFRMIVTPYELQGRHGAVIAHFDLSDLRETTLRLHRFGAYLDLLTKESGMGLFSSPGVRPIHGWSW